MTAPEALIWVLDGRPHGGIDYGTRLVERLGAAGVRVARVDLEQRHPTPTELSSPVHVLSGGTTVATEDVAWLRAGRRAMEEPLGRALGGSSLMLGVCLGSQLLAERLLGSGATAPSPKGLNIGLEALESSHTNWSSQNAVPQFHYYEVKPEAIGRRPDAELVLTGAHSLVQGFTVGEHVLGVQGHPEFTVDDVKRLVRHNTDLLTRFALCPDTVNARVLERSSMWSSQAAEDLIVAPVTRFLATGRGPGSRPSA